jgi:hypothetical protein
LKYADTDTGPLFELAKIVRHNWSASANIEPYTGSFAPNAFRAMPGDLSPNEANLDPNILYVGSLTISRIEDDYEYMSLVGFPGGAPNLSLYCPRLTTISGITAVFRGLMMHESFSASFIGYRLTRS